MLDYFWENTSLVLMDAHSNWVDIHPVNTASKEATIEKLWINFRIPGLPEKLESDNGSSFISIEFQRFMTQTALNRLHQHLTILHQMG